MRLSLLLLLAFLLAPLALSQSADVIVDPLTAEPIPLGITAPPAEILDRGDDQALQLLAQLPSGSTKSVRFREDGSVVFQDGASIVLADIVMPLRGVEADIQVVDRVILDFQPQDIFILDDLIFVATRGQGGLKVLEVTDGAQLSQIGEAANFDALAIAATSDLAFVGAGTAGLRVYDLADLSSPQLLATASTGGSANGLHLDGDLLFVANGNPGGADNFLIYNVADPAAPALLGGYNPEGFVTNVAVKDNVAFLSGGSGLVALDVTNPAEPAFLDSFAAGGQTTYEVSITGDDLVVAGLAGLFHVDISDPAELVLRGSFPIDGQGLGAAIHPDYPVAPFALLGDRFLGARLLLLAAGATPVEPIEIAFYRNGGFSHKLVFEGDYLYVTDLAGALRIFDVSEMPQEAPGLVSVTDVPSNTQWLLVEDGLAYVADADFGGTGLRVVDVSDPADPEIIGAWNSANQAFGLDKAGDVLYLANGFSGLVALDVSNPQAPSEIGALPLGSNVVDVAVRNDVAFVTSFGGGMIAIDVSNPAEMTQISAQAAWGFLNAIDLGDSAVWGDLAAVADGALGLRIVDISDPQNLESVLTAPTASQARDVAASRGFFAGTSEAVAYVADDFFGLRVFTSEGDELASFRSADRGIGVAARDVGEASWVALAAGETGIYIFEGPFFVSGEDGASATTLALEAIYPNPAAGRATVAFTLVESGEATVAVFDLLGRRVAELSSGLHTAGGHEVHLDTAALATGTYIVRLSTAEGAVSQRLTVVR